jgi:hypothetical protein
MRRITCALFGCVAASTLTLAAQSQTQSVQPTPSAAPSGATVTVVGCIENAVADGSLGGTPLGTSATPNNAGVVANVQPPVDGFLLTGARPVADAAVGTSGAAAGTPAATNAPPAKEELKTYALEGDRNELAAHKGHRVEITGALAPAAPSGVNPRDASGDDAFKTGVQRLRVQTLTMKEAKCK